MRVRIKGDRQRSRTSGADFFLLVRCQEGPEVYAFVNAYHMNTQYPLEGNLEELVQRKIIPRMRWKIMIDGHNCNYDEDYEGMQSDI